MRRRAKKTAVTITGFTILIMGIIMIPYPGPGWLVVFAALGILSTEYAWARRILDYGKAKYDAWGRWLRRQNPGVLLLVNLCTTAVVLGTVWLINGYGVINHLLGLGWDWADSPLPIFHQ